MAASNRVLDSNTCTFSYSSKLSFDINAFLAMNHLLCRKQLKFVTMKEFALLRLNKTCTWYIIEQLLLKFQMLDKMQYETLTFFHSHDNLQTPLIIFFSFVKKRLFLGLCHSNTLCRESLIESGNFNNGHKINWYCFSDDSVVSTKHQFTFSYSFFSGHQIVVDDYYSFLA